MKDVINVKFHYDSSDRLNGFTISGHAGYDEPGRDIICSAISALAVNTVNSIEKLTDDKFIVNNDDSGLLELEVLTLTDSSILLLNSLYIGIESIVKSYGNGYVNIVK